jgi:hypothetical protein
MKQLLKIILPHGLVRLWQRRQERGYQLSRDFFGGAHESLHSFSYDEIIAFLCKRGLDEQQVREGSIPDSSLRYLASILLDASDKSGPLLGLHIGNFLGVSLAFLTSTVRNIHPNSIVLAIDPNLEHRGMAHPQDHVCALLHHFGLSSHVTLCCGFSCASNIANDGRNYEDNYRLLYAEEIAASVEQSIAPQQIISQLQRLGAGPFDFAVIDGNHESDYVRQELEQIHALMKPGALVFMDDVSEGWPMLKQVFETSNTSLYHCREGNGRIGVLEVLSDQSS